MQAARNLVRSRPFVRPFFAFLRAPPAPPPAPPPVPPPPPDGHRAFGEAEMRYLATMARAPPYSHARNPGVRVLPDVLSQSETDAALAAVDDVVLPR